MMPFVKYKELKEFYTIKETCELFEMEKGDLKEKCECYDVIPRRNEIGGVWLCKVRCAEAS